MCRGYAQIVERGRKSRSYVDYLNDLNLSSVTTVLSDFVGFINVLYLFVQYEAPLISRRGDQ
ncbi:hypothetical protein BCON_0239g00160 [Botryotinia convoluta]|uniref:Uncharacterized protein n=1 Tax=Botryotinia convoluta TaxID=54673 RepID=A0A4Z1HP14_9HELO|nr:hypothetical protein BCON_0239g00160 [Botryotinia convoluta]